ALEWESLTQGHSATRTEPVSSEPPQMRPGMAISHNNSVALASDEPLQKPRDQHLPPSATAKHVWPFSVITNLANRVRLRKGTGMEDTAFTLRVIRRSGGPESSALEERHTRDAQFLSEVLSLAQRG